MIDSSLDLAWVLPDESSARADRLLGRLAAQDVLWVTALWWYEIANALMMAERRRRNKEADRLTLIQLYGPLPIRTDAHLTADTIRQIQSLALALHLSAYDAAYLELAARKSLTLATLAKPLRRALHETGLETALSISIRGEQIAQRQSEGQDHVCAVREDDRTDAQRRVLDPGAHALGASRIGHRIPPQESGEREAYSSEKGKGASRPPAQARSTVTRSLTPTNLSPPLE